MGEEIAEIPPIPEDTADLLQKLEDFSGKTVKIPVLGEIGMMDLPKYLPLYLSATKTKAVRDLVPKEVHKAILEFAYATGIEEKPQTKTKLEDIPLPRSALIQTILNMHDQGWGDSQIAKQLNVGVKTNTVLIDEGIELRDERKVGLKIKKRLSEWLKRRVEERLSDQFQLNAARLERLVQNGEQNQEKAPEQKP